MRQVPIRDLSGDVIQEAAGRGERLALTNNHLICGVVVPLDRRHLEREADWNLSRVLHSAEMATKYRENGMPLSTLDELVAEHDRQASAESSELIDTPKRFVAIRDLNGSVLEEAAATGTRVVVTNNRVVCALVIPVTRQWLNRIAEENLSRILRSTQASQRDLRAGNPLADVDDLAGEAAAL